MWRILATLLVIGLAIQAIKIAFVFLVLAGLIFRTKETAGLLILFALIAIFNRYTAVCLAIGGVALVYATYRWIGKKDESPDSEQLSLPLSDPPDG